MILLQVTITGKVALVFIVGLFLLIGIPALTSIIMKFYGESTGKKENSKKGKAYFAELVPFISIIAFSVFILLLLLYLLAILFEISFPSFE